MASKTFDLNIEKILENWETRHAVREVIANALDEQALTNTASTIIEKKGDSWFIRDFGRGIRYTHLTQNENQEKLSSTVVIGRFGIGLKDALATFERHGVEVTIKSKFGIIKTTKMVKQGFGDIVTLHALIEDPVDTDFIGTEFELRNVSDNEIDAAKKLFFLFSGEPVLETTRYGQIIRRQSGPGSIYINGVMVAEEVNFLFSYNITLLNAAIKKAINRERANVGRTAYAESVKKILLSSNNADVAQQLSRDLANYQSGMAHDELAWLDVQEHAVKILNTQGNVVVVTAEEALSRPDLMDDARNSGLSIVTIPENLRAKVANSVDVAGNRIVDITAYTQSYNESFVFKFVERESLSENEKDVFSITPWVLETFGGKPENVESIRISSTMRPETNSTKNAIGCWDQSTASIVISREELGSKSRYAAVLMHELIHAKTGFSDVTRDFETSLTVLIGRLCQGWIETSVSTEKIAAIAPQSTPSTVDWTDVTRPSEHYLPMTTAQKKPWFKFW